jgi:hypothetical protein
LNLNTNIYWLDGRLLDADANSVCSLSILDETMTDSRQQQYCRILLQHFTILPSLPISSLP